MTEKHNSNDFDKSIRLECLKLSKKCFNLNTDDVLRDAERFYKFASSPRTGCLEKMASQLNSMSNQNNLCIEIGSHTPEEYIRELRQAVLSVVKANFKEKGLVLTEDETAGIYFLLDFLERVRE